MTDFSLATKTSVTIPEDDNINVSGVRIGQSRGFFHFRHAGDLTALTVGCRILVSDTEGGTYQLLLDDDGNPLEILISTVGTSERIRVDYTKWNLVEWAKFQLVDAAGAGVDQVGADRTLEFWHRLI